MKLLAAALAVAPFVGQALASLNCTVIADTVTARECEWEGCAPRATAVAGDVLHAGCRADCSTLDDPWLQLYDGSFVRTNEVLANCRYFCTPFEIVGLPTCAWEHNQTDPGLQVCAASSAMGESMKLAKTVTLGEEPAAFEGVPTAGTACDWTNTPATVEGGRQTGVTLIGDPMEPVVAEPTEMVDDTVVDEAEPEMPEPTAAPELPDVEERMVRRFRA